MDLRLLNYTGGLVVVREVLVALSGLEHIAYLSETEGAEALSVAGVRKRTVDLYGIKIKVLIGVYLKTDDTWLASLPHRPPAAKADLAVDTSRRIVTLLS